jgi:hypothetical protein
VLPVATLLVGIAIAALLNFITQNHKIKTGVAAPILMISIVIAIILAVQGAQPSFHPNSADPAPVKIDRINIPIPRCASLAGQGDVPANKNLWLAIQLI